MLGIEHERGAEDPHMGGRRLAAGEPREQAQGDVAIGPGSDRASCGEIDPRRQPRRAPGREAALPAERWSA